MNRPLHRIANKRKFGYLPKNNFCTIPKHLSIAFLEYKYNKGLALMKRSYFDFSFTDNMTLRMDESYNHFSNSYTMGLDLI